jgi:hypothetical protein
MLGESRARPNPQQEVIMQWSRSWTLDTVTLEELHEALSVGDLTSFELTQVLLTSACWRHGINEVRPT